MVLKGAMVQAVIGLAIGVPVALLSARLLTDQMYGVTGHDVAVMVGSIVVLTVAAAVAGLIPARRAASINPVQALRTE
jgi:macrolide transport system ATP-binding/permease protein